MNRRYRSFVLTEVDGGLFAAFQKLRQRANMHTKHNIRRDSEHPSCSPLPLCVSIRAR